MGQQRLEIAKFRNQRGGGLDADAGRAGHIVAGVASQGLDIDDAVRLDAEIGLDFGHPNAPLLALA